MSTDTVTQDEESDARSLAQCLGNAITDLPAYRRFMEMQKAVANSEEAQKKITEFEQIRQEFMLSRQTGDVSEEQLQELQTTKAELNSIPEMADYLEAQSQLDAQLTELNDIISHPLAVDFGQKAGSCCEE